MPLASLLTGTGDAWLVVEAGAPLPLIGDLDCNGVPDTTDNDGDGAVNWKDVDGPTEDPGNACLDRPGIGGVSSGMAGSRLTLGC